MDIEYWKDQFWVVMQRHFDCPYNNCENHIMGDCTSLSPCPIFQGMVRRNKWIHMIEGGVFIGLPFVLVLGVIFLICKAWGV